MSLIVKHQYRVEIHWLDHPVEYKDALAINALQAKDKVIQGGGKGMYNAEKSKAKVVKYNVAVKRS
jgi:hypothetical protein